MVSAVAMVVGMVALEGPGEAVVMAVVVDLWVPPHHLGTGGVASDPMHMEVEEEAAAAAVSGVGETATSGLDVSICHV